MEKKIDQKYLIDAAAHGKTLQEIEAKTSVAVKMLIPLCTLWGIRVTSEDDGALRMGKFIDRNIDPPPNCKSGFTVVNKDGQRRGRILLTTGEYQAGTFGVL